MNAEKRVIYTDSKSKFTRNDKIKFLEDAIKNGGYYDDNGSWNSIAVFSGDDHVYRVRVETLIIKNGSFIFLKFLPRDQNHHKKYKYLIPGGSIVKNFSNMDQAINECKEEARIIVKNIQSTGITYKDISNPPKWAIERQAVNWNGNITEVYIAEYDRMYKGHIEKVDEDKFMLSGKFYPIEKIYHHLRPEHQDALNMIYPNRFKNKEKVTAESVDINKEKILNDVIEVLINAGYQPKISVASKDAFLCNKPNNITDGSVICIAGFKYKDVKKAAAIVNSKLKYDNVRCEPDNYGTIFLYIGKDILIEKALTTIERNELDNSEFGIPSLRKFPLHDKAHVIQAIRFFNTVDRMHEKELAHNIKKAMSYYDIDSSIVGERNRLISYL